MASQGLLDNLIERGLDSQQSYLFAIDGSKALRAIDVSGEVLAPFREAMPKLRRATRASRSTTTRPCR